MFGSILGAIAGPIVGGLFGKDRSDSANQANQELSAEQRQFAVEQSQREYERQKEFAQMGVRWRAADAQAAGLHPMAALGGGASYSPTVVMPSSHQVVADNSLGEGISRAISGAGDAWSRMGQNTTRAELATQNPFERELQVLALRRAELQNQLIEGQIAAQWASVMGQPGNPPMAADAGPSRGVIVTPVNSPPRSAPRGLVQIEPSKAISGSPRNAGVEAGSSPFAKRHELGHGVGVRLPSQAASEALESLGPLGWIAGAGLTGYQALREWWKGPEGGPPHPGLRWDRWKQAWTNR